MVANKPAISHVKGSHTSKALSISASRSLQELLDSLSSEQIRNQDLLTSLSFALRSFTNLHRFLEVIPLILSRLLVVEGSLLIPFQPDGHIWRDQVHASPLEISQDLIRQLMVLEERFKDGFVSDEKSLDSLDLLVQRNFGNFTILTTSIVARGRQYGRLYAFDKKERYLGSDIHRKHLQLVADLIGVAIENDFILKVIRRHESVDRQLNIGGEIQAQLLPDRCPVIHGVDLAARCRPAFQVGGDYYDFMPTRPELTGRTKERGSWALVIGDVMGKGIPAGLLMTMLRGMLRAEVLSGLPPNQILHDLNQLALEDLTQSHRFVTLFYSDFDARSRKLRYANAAHNPPLLWSSEKKSISRLDAPGLLIGLQPDAEYGCGEITLEPGDILLYYTDGVTEAPGMAGDRFDEYRLVNFLEDAARAELSAKEILNRLFKRLDAFVGVDHQLEDDASMVVLKVKDEIKLPTLIRQRTDN